MGLMLMSANQGQKKNLACALQRQGFEKLLPTGYGKFFCFALLLYLYDDDRTQDMHFAADDADDDSQEAQS